RPRLPRRSEGGSALRQARPLRLLGRVRPLARLRRSRRASLRLQGRVSTARWRWTGARLTPNLWLGGADMAQTRSVGVVGELWRFPVKSMAGERLEAAEVTAE